MRRGAPAAPAASRWRCSSRTRRPRSRRGRRWNARVVALSRASERLLSAAGAWPLIDGPRVCAYQRMRIWHESVASSQRCGAGIRCRRRRGAEPRLHPREPPAAGTHSCEAFSAAGGQLDAGRARVARDHRGGRCACARRPGSCAARLVVGADGAHSSGARGRRPQRRERRRTSSWRSSPTSRPPSRTSSPPGSAS